MILKNLLQVLCVNTYVLDFYNGNVEGLAVGEVVVSNEGALDYGNYAVHVIHRVSGETAEITLRSKDWRNGLEGGQAQ